MVDTPEKRDITKEEVNEALQTDILNGLKEVNDLMSQLGHGEKERLLMANLAYPLQDTDFSGDKPELNRAFSASKRITDAMIALGVQVSLENMIQQGINEGVINE